MHFKPSAQANISTEQGRVQRDSDSSEPSSQISHPSQRYKSAIHCNPSAQANSSDKQETECLWSCLDWWFTGLIARDCLCSDQWCSLPKSSCIWCLGYKWRAVSGCLHFVNWRDKERAFNISLLCTGPFDVLVPVVISQKKQENLAASCNNIIELGNLLYWILRDLCWIGWIWWIG